jgi:hypothetical protein
MTANGEFRSVDSASSPAEWEKIVSAFNVELQPDPPSSTSGTAITDGAEMNRIKKLLSAPR